MSSPAAAAAVAVAATHPPSDTIRTERLLLRPLSPTDRDGVFAIRSDPRVLYWTSPDTREASDSWVKARLESPKSLCYTVSLLPSPSSPSPQIIGLTGAHSVPEVGYLFRPSSWGHGYATEALQAWMQWYWKRYKDGHPVLEKGEDGYLKAMTGPGGRVAGRC